MTETLAGPEARDGLAIEGLSVAYDGTLAVSDLSMAAGLGRITGLIGPNGAGKTTTFNACSGLLSPTAGTVRLGGHDVTRRGPAARAQLGLGRTFQRVELCSAMTVRTNVSVGVEARAAGANPVRQVFSGRRPAKRIAEGTDAALQLCGIAALADRMVSGLSTGQRRLVELARVLASDFRLLLLDEPSSGLDETETATMSGILRVACTERGIGILLVEHDMSMVMDLCEYIYVLDFGKQIFEGTPAETMGSEVVRQAYLGGDVEAVG
jgi:ABC-type branched-subunit amino acid transport system ATPase component